METKSFQELFNDWVEPDDAVYYLACILGIMEYHEVNTPEFFEYYPKVKSVFAVKTEIGSMLYNMLEELAKGRLLEKRDDWDYRWNKSYLPYWEGGKDGR